MSYPAADYIEDVDAQDAAYARRLQAEEAARARYYYAPPPIPPPRYYYGTWRPPPPTPPRPVVIYRDEDPADIFVVW